MPDLGPLSPFFQDDAITEIMVNDTRNIYIEKEGRCFFSGTRISDPKILEALVNNLVKSSEHELSFENSCGDFALPDGSRVNIIKPPLTVGGPAITIRRFSKKQLTMDDLMKNETLDQKLAYFLNVCVVARLNILISGGTGSGKTTFLNILSQFIPKSERIVSIEDTPELSISHENSVRLQTRTHNPNTYVNERDLLTNALRMRPDRIILGECRRGEALDMLQAMNTGHDGSMTTIHSNSSREALYRLETLVLMSGLDLPLKVIRKHIASSIDLIIQTKRLRGGLRKVTEVCEVTGMEGDTILLQELFMMDSSKIESTAKVKGFVPKFLSKLQEKGINITGEYFQDS